MLPLNWGDQLSLKVQGAENTQIFLKSKNLKLNPKKNLVYRAAELFSMQMKVNFRAEIQLIKNVPTGAGLGGGSSDAAKTLELLANWYLTSGGSRARLKKNLHSMAAKLGSDIPFFLKNTPAWCTGFGEKCDWLSPGNSWPLVLVLPTQKVPTPWAYRELDRAREKYHSVQMKRDFPKWIFDSEIKIPKLENDFEEIIFKLKPALKNAAKVLAQSGALAIRMSGSGSSFFGVYESEAVAKKAAVQIRRKKIKALFVKATGVAPK